jgi:hypothetical protein
MSICQTTPEQLAGQIVENIGKEVRYGAIPVDGARNAAQLINELL